MSGSRGGRSYSDQQNLLLLLLLLENVLASSPPFAEGGPPGARGNLPALCWTCGEKTRSWRGHGPHPRARTASGGGARLGWQSGYSESGAAGDIPLAHRPPPPSPAKSLHPALNLMTQIRALKVFATDRTRSFINNDLHIDA